MTDPATDIFLPSAGTGPAWDAAREQVTRPRNDEAPLEGFRAGMAVRDLLARYTYALDQRDVDGMLGYFADDAVLTNGRGRHVGKAAIRADLEAHFHQVPRSLHLWSNVVVRLSSAFDEAQVTSYFYAMLAPRSAPAKSVGGLAADRVAKRDGSWLICERTATVDVATGLAPLAGSQGAEGESRE